MTNQLTQCETTDVQLEGAISKQLQLLCSSGVSGFTEALNKLEKSWLLWVEPIAKPNSSKCPAMFDNKTKGQLLEKLNQDWQFSEAYWFSENKTLHLLQTGKGLLMKQVVADVVSSKVSKTPYLWQKSLRFDHLIKLKEQSPTSLWFSNSALQFVECVNQRAEIEFVLKEHK
ncbi:hypothetical protein [Agarivorans sp. QJM3NY_33]|uniref:hypothetical protein n=1 Tax=Agarivorans sp. QJM3NY_33 TaxID=3421432 RepID=UPI003D7DB7E2